MDSAIAPDRHSASAERVDSSSVLPSPRARVLILRLVDSFGRHESLCYPIRCFNSAGFVTNTLVELQQKQGAQKVALIP